MDTKFITIIIAEVACEPLIFFVLQDEPWVLFMQK